MYLNLWCKTHTTAGQCTAGTGSLVGLFFDHLLCALHLGQPLLESPCSVMFLIIVAELTLSFVLYVCVCVCVRAHMCACVFEGVIIK